MPHIVFQHERPVKGGLAENIVGRRGVWGQGRSFTEDTVGDASSDTAGLMAS